MLDPTGSNQMIDTSNDPKIIESTHSGVVTREGVTIKLCIYRLERTKWTLEVVDAQGTSTVWDDEFETDDDALAEFERTVRESGMLEFVPTTSKRLN
jgi:hypothetical protein